MLWFDNCFFFHRRLLEAGYRLGVYYTDEETVLWKFDRKMQTSLHSSKTFLSEIVTTLCAYSMRIRHTTTEYKGYGTRIVCLRLFPRHCIWLLVLEKTDRTSRISILDFIFGWILYYAGRCYELVQNAYMGAWKSKKYICPCKSKTFSHKLLDRTC